MTRAPASERADLAGLHEVHHRRRGRNLGLLAVLAGLIAIVFALTVVKVRTGGFAEAFDHVARPQMAIEREVTE